MQEAKETYEKQLSKLIPTKKHFSEKWKSTKRIQQPIFSFRERDKNAEDSHLAGKEMLISMAGE